MLSAKDNDLLCQIGPGTPMGKLVREYWIPAVRSDELTGPDSPPLRVKLLGEELIAYRVSSGKVGLIQNSCPHRGASLFYGRNEEDGLRCVYHGWKFDSAGQCVDMPSEPPESVFKTKVKAVSYPTIERNGIIWAYMGARTIPPPLPDMEANLLNTNPERISVLHRACNWMQGIEGELDTIHAAFLHWGAEKTEDYPPDSFMYYGLRQREARFVVRDNDFGCSYGAYRPAEEDSYYWRIAHVMFPFYAFQPQSELGPTVKMNAYVPMDDEHTLQWEISLNVNNPPNEGMLAPINRGTEPVRRGRGGSYMPHTTDWYGRFNLEQSSENDYQIDREEQRTWGSYSGIAGIRQQDMAVTESMGPIYKRWNEHLGTTDAMIIRTRMRWIAAARALEDLGQLPPGVDNPRMYRERSGEVILSRSIDWWDGSEALRHLWSVKEPEETPVSGS